MSAHRNGDRPDEHPIDFRAHRSLSVEGRSNALRARQAQLDGRQFDGERPVDPVDVLRELQLTEELLGFWVLWHTLGGFEALVRFGSHPATVWRKIRRFRTATGQHPDEFTLDGVIIDHDRFWSSCIDRDYG